MWRSRWAAIGAAVAVTFGAGGLVAVNAAPSAPSSVVTIDPVRVLDTRAGGVGVMVPYTSQASQKVQITGSILTRDGMKVIVPAGATGVLLNATVASPTADGFLSVRPGDATGAPTTSSLNFTTGAPAWANAVQVGLPTTGANAGKIDITYDAYGKLGPTTDVLIDVVGYTIDAKHPRGYAALVADSIETAWPSNDLRSVRVACPSGMNPTGGGGSNGLDAGVVLDSSYPFPLNSSSPTEWLAVYRNVSGDVIPSITIRAHVMCMVMPGP